MKIRNRLTLISSVTFSVVFIAAAMIIYIAFYKSSQKRIYDDMQRICLLSAIYYLEKDELPIEEHEQIREQFNENIQDIGVGIYNQNNKVQYGNNLSIKSITPQILAKVRKEKKYGFESKQHFYFGIFYKDNQGDFVVFVQADDKNFKAQNHQLMVIMGVVLLSGLLVIYLLSFYLSKLAYKPIHDIVQQVNKMEATSLDQSVVNLNSRDELHYVIASYNSLLQRLSDTFKVQKNFINYVSHEFKTPLASIVGHLEVFGLKDRSPKEYQETTQKVLKNVYEIEEILNTLLIISGKKSQSVQNEFFRVDELIWDISDKIAEAKPLEMHRLRFEIRVEEDTNLTVKGNESEISIAIYNCIDNAIKYSNDSILIELNWIDEQLQLRIVDTGIGISETDLKQIKETFFRGNNIGTVQGSGIGLSLATIVLAKNNIDFEISSQLNVGTTVTLTFKNL